ncbi:MAG: glycoside hydrolase family 2 protein, partial [Lachnospiraceae bacterium]|nr:glycoside hydrolase family 2 protein [Lachnospiraceae bacterium]
MRKIYKLQDDWIFLKDIESIADIQKVQGEAVRLPHTWNAIDGQDGGNDYFRGTCGYVRSLNGEELPIGEKYYLEITGANSSAQVFINGQKLAEHDGGYSTWRVDITEALKEENQLVILVDNASNERVYPQTADFTFYGGLYREVNIIAVPKTHFSLSYFGGPGIKVTPVIEGADARVELETFVEGMQADDTVLYTILDAEGMAVAQECIQISNVAGINAYTAKLFIKEVHLWNGRKDPYLYTARVCLKRGEEKLDEVCLRFGCRSFAIDPEKGFFLNGRSYPLRGVSRHQDRLGIGNALLPEHHREDMELIAEVGANTIRLAHYQHDQYFYYLCDEYGMVVWDEIPYKSNHLPTADDNTISQMKELVVQNYHHPSIVVWGLSNEITMGGAKDADLLRNHRELNELVHDMDKTRLTTMACLSMCGIDETYVHIPDVVAYNHYFGWYGGDTSMNGPWFDKFHAKYPNKPIGISEYGCEGLNWHSSNPQQGDYTEEYQAYYHEELIKQLFTRPYIWATYVWNMFDFGADARSEGGENGQNHKGLVTMDRKYKKDAFYAYKAWLSDEPFVHLCGKRYVDRVEEVTKVTVYSNQPQVELFVNGV